MIVAAKEKDSAPPIQREQPIKPWYLQSATAVVKSLGTDETQGLSQAEAEARLAANGPNELVEGNQRKSWQLLWEQLTAVMVLILIGAAVLSLLLGKTLEAGAIGAIVVLFAALGFVQEYRAEKAIAALKKLAVPAVRVLRNGALQEVSARELVVGDVVVLEAGNVVPADVRILTSANLRIQEAALTGESEPVEKTSEVIALVDAPLAERRNMGYMGTQVTYGRGAAAVVATGMDTELGRIADLLQTVDAEMTPLQRKLDRVGKALALAGVVIAGIMLAIGLAAGESLGDMVLTAIGVAVAVIPEGLPAVVTFTLAVGAQHMLKRNALIRKLPAVETLGSVTVICSDKTGTLTQNRMTVTVIDADGDRITLTEHLHHRNPEFHTEAHVAQHSVEQPPVVKLLLAAGALCNDAQLSPTGAGTDFHTIGDPTEGALLVAAAQGGVDPEQLRRELPRGNELPFDSDRKRMTTLHALPSGEAQGVWSGLRAAMPGHYVAVTKGAVDGLLAIATQVWEQGAPQPLTPARKQRIEEVNNELARRGMRVLGIALRVVDEPIVDGIEANLTFLGLVGMIDPPRPEVRVAVDTCRTAGIRPVMITGDHPLTAITIAHELGIASNDRVLTGADLSAMEDDELERVVADVSVFARVSPEHKLRIVGALQRRGNIVAMTGDGVNDAPALKKADIGVAMGITGTDVSKEAADMVLRDDNFATIVASVEEGRVIYDNLRRFVKFAVAGNVGKIAVMLLWPALFLLTGQPLTVAVALLPLQLLWLNLLTDGLLGLSMGAEPAEKNVMQRPPNRPDEGIFTNGMGWQVIWSGALIGALALGVGAWYYANGLAEWQTMMFMTLAMLQVFQALATRSNTESLFRIGVFSNRLMWLSIAGVVVLQLIAIYVPPISTAFLNTVPLDGVDLAIAVGAGVVLFAAIELEKWFIRRQQPVAILAVG